MSCFLFSPKRAEPFVFLHLPKAAGTSIRHGVLTRLPVQRSLIPEGTEDWPWDRSFMILRDPVDRFLSGWGERASHYTLDDLLALLSIDSIEYNPPGYPNNGPVDIRHHLLPLTHEINKPMIDKVTESGSWVKFEHLSEGIPKIIEWLGLVRPPLKHQRKGSNRRSRESLSEEEEVKIREFFKKDYELLESFDGPFGGKML